MRNQPVQRTGDGAAIGGNYDMLDDENEISNNYIYVRNLIMQQVSWGMAAPGEIHGESSRATQCTRLPKITMQGAKIRVTNNDGITTTGGSLCSP